MKINTLLDEIATRYRVSGLPELGHLISLEGNIESLLGRINTPETILSIEDVRNTDLLEVRDTLAELKKASPSNQMIVNLGNVLVKGIQRYCVEVVEDIHTEESHNIVQFQTALAQLSTELLEAKRPMGISNHDALNTLEAMLEALHAIDITNIHALNQHAIAFLKELMSVKQAAATTKDIDFIYRIQAYSDPMFGALSRLSREFPTLSTIKNEEALSKSIAETTKSTAALLDYAKETISDFCTLYLEIETFQEALATWELKFQATTLLDSERETDNETLRQAYIHFKAALSTPDAQALINQNQGLAKALNAIIITVNALLWLVGLSGFQKISREKTVSSIEHNLSLFKDFTDAEDTDENAVSCLAAA